MIHHFIPFLATVLLVTGSLVAAEAGASAAADGDAAKAVAPIIFQNLCATCHGTKGEGKVELKSPSIASLPAWYVERQLKNFQTDRRGAHPEDAEGQLMRVMAKTLSKEQTSAIAALVEGLPRVKPSRTLQTDVARGKEVYEERCMECHRFNGEGEIVFGAAPLVGLQDWYLAAQLRKFKAGIRGAAKNDENGQKMVKATANFVEDEEMVQSLAAWLVQLQEVKKPAPAAEADVVFGKD